MFSIYFLSVIVAIAYAQTERNCGRVSDVERGQIIGGSEAARGQFPWQVSMEYYNVDLDEWRHMCGASLIDELWVISAAHCYIDELTDYRMILGQHDRFASQEEENKQIIDIQIENIHRHEGYSGADVGDDIMVIKLTVPADLSNPMIETICLPESIDSKYVDNTDCSISGWGLMGGRDEDVPNLLQYSDINVITTRSCRTLNPIVDGETMICVRDVDGGLEAGSCNGDSGGPLQCVAADGRSELAGLTSFGVIFCPTFFPSVYTRTSAYLDWIEDTMNANQ